MEDDFDEICRQQRERNMAHLKAMGLGGAILPPKTKPGKLRAPRKRKAAAVEAESEAYNAEPPSKVARAESSDGGGDNSGLRRSGRNRGKAVDYKDDATMSNAHLPRLASVQAGIKKTDTDPRSVSKRTHNPKVFGAIPGIPVGTWWQSREECSIDAVHAPWVAGISSGAEGAFSVALSGGYEDDVDLGDAFTYTGSGGRDLKGTNSQPKNLRTAPQSCHQSFENPFNKALKKSCETRNPIRVIRGYKLKSPYAPGEGYRYDGLYTVEKAWMEKGLNKQGWNVCKFAFKRVPGQAPLQFNDGDGGDASGSDRESSAEVHDRVGSPAEPQ